MNQDYTPGEGCECSARCSCECGCDVDWTPREVYELRATISDLETRHAATMLHTQSIVDEANELREQRDRLAEALRVVMADYRLDGRVSAEADMLASEALAAVKGGSDE